LDASWVEPVPVPEAFAGQFGVMPWLVRYVREHAAASS
jgi:hypothetical protein